MGKKPIKVLSLYWGYSIGGVGKYGTLINKVGAYKPVEMSHVCILNDDWQCDIDTLAVLDATLIKINSRADFSWVGKLKKAIDEIKPDSIMTHGFNGHTAALLSRFLGHHKLPMLVSYHGLYHGTTTVRSFIAPIYNTLTELHIKYFSSAVISVSEYSKQYLEKKGVASDKVSVIHNGIPDIKLEPEKSSALRNEWNVKDNEVLLGIASRIDPVKGLGYLVDAMPALVKENPNIRLVIIGTGTEEELLQQKVKNHGLEYNVFFTGFRSDIQDCLGAFDIFVLPSLAEYHSIALLEAMRAGKKIVSSDVGGNTESVRDMQEGYIIESKSSQQIEKAITAMLGDMTKAETLATNARARFLEVFTEDTMIAKTADWLAANGARE